MGGIASASDSLGLGPSASFELGGRSQLEGFSFAFALRARYERFTSNGVATCAALALGCASAPGTSAYALTREETLVTVEVPVTARLGAERGTIFPYLGVAPGLVYDHHALEAAVGAASTGDARGAYASETSGRLSMHAFAGTQLHVGPGGFFFEWGIRAAPIEHRPDGDSHLTTFLGSLGYRLTL